MLTQACQGLLSLALALNNTKGCRMSGPDESMVARIQGNQALCQRHRWRIVQHSQTR